MLVDDGAKLGPGRCTLCGRDEELTFHHLIPRTLHPNKWFKARFEKEALQAGVELCRDCHGAIHEIVPSEKELGREWNTLERLRENEALMTYVRWLDGRPGRRPYRTGNGGKRRKRR